MQIVEKILTRNDCYKSGRTIRPKGIVVHSTAVNQKNVVAFTTQWDRPNVSKCVHAFIGLWEGKLKVVQTLPWNRRCWGCGKGSKGTYNDSYIQFEICEDDTNGREWFNSVYDTAAELCAMLVQKYKLDVKNVICHSEAHARGYASNHGDVMHWFPKHGRNMDTFRNLVRTKMEGKKFDPNNVLTRAQAVTFLYRMAGSPEPTGTMPFKDVKPTSYYFKAVLWALSRWITSGVTKTSFAPNKNCTRAQFITMLYRYAGSPVIYGKNRFDDVKDHDYFYEAVQWAVDHNITTGTTERTFSPDKPCTRAQAVTLLYRYANNPETVGPSFFIDVSPEQYFYKPVLWAYKKGITAGA